MPSPRVTTSVEVPLSTLAEKSASASIAVARAFATVTASSPGLRPAASNTRRLSSKPSTARQVSPATTLPSTRARATKSPLARSYSAGTGPATVTTRSSNQSSPAATVLSSAALRVVGVTASSEKPLTRWTCTLGVNDVPARFAMTSFRPSSGSTAAA
jgi:hypothetical protein